MMVFCKFIEKFNTCVVTTYIKFINKHRLHVQKIFSQRVSKI